MISRFFKKQEKKSPKTARKVVTAEKPTAKAKPAYQKTQTAEGWRRMMTRTRKGKKA